MCCRTDGSAGKDQADEPSARSAGAPQFIGCIAGWYLLPAHMAIVLQIAFGKILADPIVLLDVFRSQIPVLVSIDGVEILVGRGFALHVMFTGIV